MIVYCGRQLHSACMAIYGNYEQVENTGDKKPEKVLSLLEAKVEKPTYSPVGSQNSSPSSNRTPQEKACQFLVIHSNETN